ncbi:MAG: nucleoside triphosphate pyrophosphatase [Rubrivivax sp.]
MKLPEPPFIYLASQSPRRAQLLDQLGVAHRPLLPAADEDAEALEAERPGEAPRDYVQRVTLAKLAAARQRLRARGLPPAPILAADTTVALGRRILGKPRDAADAAAMLAALSGRSHRVLTAVALAWGAGGRQQQMALSESHVHFAPLPPAVIRHYVAGGEPMGKAGAYAIQGAIAGWVRRIDGSHSGIMGLPLFETAQLLARARFSLPMAPPAPAIRGDVAPPAGARRS